MVKHFTLQIGKVANHPMNTFTAAEADKIVEAYLKQGFIIQHVHLLSYTNDVINLFYVLVAPVATE